MVIGIKSGYQCCAVVGHNIHRNITSMSIRRLLCLSCDGIWFPIILFQSINGGAAAERLVENKNNGLIH